MGLRIGVGGKLGPIRGGISTRGIGAGIGPFSAGTSYGRRRRSGGSGSSGNGCGGCGTVAVIVVASALVLISEGITHAAHLIAPAHHHPRPTAAVPSSGTAISGEAATRGYQYRLDVFALPTQCWQVTGSRSTPSDDQPYQQSGCGDGHIRLSTGQRYERTTVSLPGGVAAAELVYLGDGAATGPQLALTHVTVNANDAPATSEVTTYPDDPQDDQPASDLTVAGQLGRDDAERAPGGDLATPQQLAWCQGQLTKHASTWPAANPAWQHAYLTTCSA